MRRRVPAVAAGFVLVACFLPGAAAGEGGGSVEVTASLLPGGRSATASFWDGSNAYLLGGFDGARFLDEIVRYEPGSGTVTTLAAKLPSARAGTAAVFDGRHAYLFGGYNATDHFGDILRFDPTSGALDRLSAKLPSPRMGAGVAWDGTSAYIFGGRDGEFRLLNEVVRFSPKTLAVELVETSLPSRRAWTSAVWLGDRAYIFGGGDESGRFLTDVLSFSPVSGEVTFRDGFLPTGRIYMGAATVGPVVYMMGGFNGSSTSDILRYDPRYDTIELLPEKLPLAAAWPAAVTDGAAIHVLGGFNGSVHYSHVLRYSPPPPPPFDHPPTARFSFISKSMEVSLDASASSDPEAQPLQYVWDWGDSAPRDEGVKASHRYAKPGSYSVTLTVTDAAGASESLTKEIPTSTRNQAPIAAFVYEVVNLTLSVDARETVDPEAENVTYAWNWGDGSPAGLGPVLSHTYLTDGTRPVTLAATDPHGDKGEIVLDVTVGTANLAPRPRIRHAIVNLTVTVDGRGSFDPDGVVVAYRWDWGDGSVASRGDRVAHAYAGEGTYNITLTVADDLGREAKAIQRVTASIPNLRPVANFSIRVQNLTVQTDGRTSYDPDGSVSGFEWDWGDGSVPSRGSANFHHYRAAGVYSITLTVTDDRNATAKLTREASVMLSTPAAPGPHPIPWPGLGEMVLAAAACLAAASKPANRRRR